MIGAQVFDSDGAIIFAHSHPAGWWHSALMPRKIVSHAKPGYSPFDENGNLMSDQEIAEQAAAHERELDAEEQRFRAAYPTGRDAATRAITWATESGLRPAPFDDVAAALGAQDVFVEDVFHELLLVLGITRA